MFTSTYSAASDRALAITQAIAQYIIDDLRPLSVVDGSGFKNMVKLLDPRYNLPGRTHFSKTVIPKMYEHLASRVKASLSKASRAAITTDGWSGISRDYYSFAMTFPHQKRD